MDLVPAPQTLMRSRRWLVNLTLALLIGLLLLIGYQAERRTDAAQSSGRVLDLDADAISRLEIRTPAGAVLLERTQTAWSIEQPIRWPANRFNVDHLLQITAAQTESRFEAGGRELERFGLQSPLAELIVDDTAITFGDSNQIGERRYIQIGDSIFLLPDVYLPFIRQGLEAMVDRRLLPPPLQVQSFRQSQREWVRDPTSGWQARGDANRDSTWIEQRIANWQQLEASRVRAYDPSKPSRETIRAELANGETIAFEVIATNPEIVIAQPRIGLQYHFDDDHFPLLLALPDEVSG